MVNPSKCLEASTCLSCIVFSMTTFANPNIAAGARDSWDLAQLRSLIVVVTLLQRLAAATSSLPIDNVIVVVVEMVEISVTFFVWDTDTSRGLKHPATASFVKFFPLHFSASLSKWC